MAEKDVNASKGKGEVAVDNSVWGDVKDTIKKKMFGEGKLKATKGTVEKANEAKAEALRMAEEDDKK